jgi:hypothetical protein
VWPLRNVETGVNGDSKSTNERGPSFFVRLACRVPPVQEIFILPMTALVGPVHYFNSFVPIAQPAGQAVVLGRLSLSMCLCA